MSIEESANPEQERIRNLAAAWKERLSQGVDRVLADTSNPQQVFDAIWENGVMSRLVPADPAEMEARKELGKAAWLAGRDDAELYWRILYANEGMREAVRNSYSVAGGSDGLLSGAMMGINHALYEKPEFGQQFKVADPRRPENPYQQMFTNIEKHARQELHRLGQDDQRPVIPIGAHGSFREVSFTVERYTDQGLVWPQADNVDGHMALYPFVKDGGLSPSELDPGNFELPKEGE